MEDEIKEEIDQIFNNSFNVDFIRKDVYSISLPKQPTRKIFFIYNRKSTFDFNISQLQNLIIKLLIPK